MTTYRETRSWSDCQENNNNWTTVPDTAYQIVDKTGKVISDLIPYKEWAKDYVQQWSKSKDDIFELEKQLLQELECELKTLRSKRLKAIKKRTKLALKRERYILKSKKLPRNLYDLSGILGN